LGEGWKWPTLIFIFPLFLTVATAATVDMPLLIHVGAPSQQASSVDSAQDRSPRDDPRITLSGHLKTTATVLATLTGLFLTVVALTINVKTSNLAGASFLLNAVIRRRGFLPTAAFLLGTVFTALTGVLLTDRVEPQFLNDWTSVVALLSLVCLFVLFYLLRNTMQTFGTSELEQLLSAELLLCVRKTFRGKLRQSLIENQFCEKLESLGFGRCTAPGKGEEPQTEYRLDRLGSVMAIDLAPLKRMCKLLKLTPLPPGHNKASIVMYGLRDDAACVTLQPNGTVTKDSQVVLLTRERTPDKRIHSLIQRTFIIAMPSESDLPWRRLRELMSSAIQRYESTTVADVSKAFVHVFDDYLEAQTAVGGPGSLSLEDFGSRIVYGFEPPRPSALRIHELVMSAARIRSVNCLDELLNSIYALAAIAFHRRNAEYFRDWAFELCWSYDSIGSHEEDASRQVISGVLHRSVRMGQRLLDTYFLKHGESVEHVREISPYALTVMSLWLHILKTSAERFDKRTFDEVDEHFSRFLDNGLGDDHTKPRSDSLGRRDRNEGHPIGSPSNTTDNELLVAYKDIVDYKNLVYVILGAWLMHQFKASHLQAERIAPFIEKIVASTCGFRDLLDLYAMQGMADGTTQRDNPLGYHHWDWPYSLYSQVKTGTEFQRWIEPFYRLLLLKTAAKAPVRWIDLRDIRHTEGASHNDLTAFLAEMASSAYSLSPESQGLSWGLSTEEFTKAKQHIAELLTRWSSESETRPSGEEVAGRGSE